MSELSFKRFKRTYPGNYSITFHQCLSGINDLQTKTHTNFYLTNNYKFSDIFETDTSSLQATSIFGTLVYGGEYLSYIGVDPTPYVAAGNYEAHFDVWRPAFLTAPSSTTNFTVVFYDNNRCNIYFTRRYNKYYLCLDTYNNLLFIRDRLLTFNDTVIAPQDFTYLFSESGNNIIFFKKTQSSAFNISKVGTKLKAVTIVENNITSSTTPFKITKNVFAYPNISLNTSFVTYKGDNTIDPTKSSFGLSNNFLLHNDKSVSGYKTDIICLKNQLLQEDVFSSANNLLSGVETSIFVNDLREYSCIASDINTESSDELALNYVFYNKTYKIFPGSNWFTSPSSMYPYQQLNINDTKFINSGAFSYTTPEYADKVYHLSKDAQNYDNNQYLLCTWLSGSPTSDHKVWVDRYYYPDLISKEEAYIANPIGQTTYEDSIEQLIQTNTDLEASILDYSFFDKTSDLVFSPNENYRYDRISAIKLPLFESTFTYCNSYSQVYPVNYFSQINDAGEFTMGFNFEGDDSNWEIVSDRNIIDSGLTLTKTGPNITIRYTIYDATSRSYNASPSSWFLYTKTIAIKALKKNFIYISVDSKQGTGYIFINDIIADTFNLPNYQFYVKQLLYGDFVLTKDLSKFDILDTECPYISNTFINDYYIDPSLTFIIPLTNGAIKIDDIYITLPCGMRNSLDNLQYLQSVCGSSLFKSNDINIRIKNLNLADPTITSGLSASVSNNISPNMPSNTRINTITFENFK